MTAAQAWPIAGPSQAAAAFAVGNVAQFRAARRTPTGAELHMRLHAKLVRNPR